MSIARLYNFSPNNTILSAEVNAELNQLVSEVNLMFKKDASDNITGDVTIAKSNPSLIFGGSETSAKFFKIKESAGVAYFQFDNSGYANFFGIDGANDLLLCYKPIVPDTTETQSVGTSGKSFESIYLNNGATDGGAVYFDSDTTACLKALADGSQLQLGAKFTSFVPDASGGASLGTSSLPFSHLTLVTNIGTSTPVAKRLYADLIPKAWAAKTATGTTISAGVNLTCAHTNGTGVYTYSFRTNMADANYAVIATPNDFNADPLCYVVTKTTSSFVVRVRDGGALTDLAHHVVVLGTQ